MQFEPRKEVVKVDVDQLFDKKLVERLLGGERAEDITDMPGEVAEELSVIADRVVKRLLGELDVEVSEEFQHALREWIKLWIYKFYRAAENVERG